MREIRTFISVSLLAVSLPLFAQNARPGNANDQQRGRDDDRPARSWIKKLDDRAKRGTLHNALQYVRGDTGKWTDNPQWQHLPPIQQKPNNVSLDDWSEQLLEKKFQLTSDDDNWLLFRTRQLNDNDRVWVTQIERRQNQFTIVVNEAVWQGRYQKNFTYYSAIGVNLGKLEPGKYAAKLVLKPLVFDKFEDPGTPRDNWPKDERPTEKQGVELQVAFTVVAAPR